MAILKNILIGSDPEFFISNGKCFVPSIGVIPGTKHDPYEVAPGFFIQKDNVLIEGNIPPASNKKGFVDNMLELKSLMNSYLQIVDPSFHIVSGDSAPYNMDELSMFPEAMEFGCDPYQNVWSGATVKAASLAKFPHRTAGFHIHIGYYTDVNKSMVDHALVKAFDWFVTIPSRKIYEDAIRSFYYGELGAFRVKSYGVECRSLGGYFTADQYLEKVYDAVMQAIEFVDKAFMDGKQSDILLAKSINDVSVSKSLILS